MAKEPEWLTRLAQAGSEASAQKQHRERRAGSLGAAGPALATGLAPHRNSKPARTGSPAQPAAAFHVRRKAHPRGESAGAGGPQLHLAPGRSEVIRLATGTRRLRN